MHNKLKKVVRNNLNKYNKSAHPLSNQKLQKRILKYFFSKDFDDDLINSNKFKQYIENKQYELAEQICRFYRRNLKHLGYSVTEGVGYFYKKDGNLGALIFINSKGNTDGDYIVFGNNQELLLHSKHIDGKVVKYYLNTLESKT